jgi:hypothetical protein
MPQFLGRAQDWFVARGRGQKAGIIVLAFVVVLAASRVLAGVAGLAFFAVVVVLIVQLFRRRPVKKWAIAAVGSLAAVILFSSIAGAIYGPQTGQGGRGETAEKRPSPPEPEKTQSEKAQPPPPKEPAEKPEANKQPEPDPTEHLVTADEYHQLGTSEDDYIEEHILKGGLIDCIHAKYKNMYGEDAWGEVIRGYRTEADSPYGMDAPEVLMIEEGAGCTVQEGIDQLGNWTVWEWRQANGHFKDGL